MQNIKIELTEEKRKLILEWCQLTQMPLNTYISDTIYKIKQKLQSSGEIELTRDERNMILDLCYIARKLQKSPVAEAVSNTITNIEEQLIYK